MFVLCQLEYLFGGVFMEDFFEKFNTLICYVDVFNFKIESKMRKGDMHVSVS